MIHLGRRTRFANYLVVVPGIVIRAGQIVEGVLIFGMCKYGLNARNLAPNNCKVDNVFGWKRLKVWNIFNIVLKVLCTCPRTLEYGGT